MEREAIYNHKAERFNEACGYDSKDQNATEIAKSMAENIDVKLKASACPSEFAEDLIYSAIEGDKAAKYFILTAVTTLVHEHTKS